jgi:hypothetical protein
MRSFLLLLLATTCAFAIPSQRDTLNASKREALNAYNAAQRTKDKAQFIAAANGLQAVGQKVIAANQAAMSSLQPGNYPKDVKSTQAQQSWDKKMGDIRRTLKAWAISSCRPKSARNPSARSTAISARSTKPSRRTTPPL